jgi:hypothetical protein
LERKKDNEADLKESRITVEDRLTFMTAKKAELQSIFENGVWQLELEPEKASEGQVLKARFVIKRADDGKGGTKAKAPLVLQGYSDPDLLSGSLETSSPTPNRTSRQVLLSIGVLKEKTGNSYVPMWPQPFCKGTTNPASFGVIFPEIHATCWTSSQTP